MAGQDVADLYKILVEHIKDEGEQFNRIEKRIGELMSSISAHMMGQQDCSAAFLKDTDGNPDHLGHAEDHRIRLKEAEARADFYKKMKFELSKWGLILFCGWFLLKITLPAVLAAIVSNGMPSK